MVTFPRRGEVYWVDLEPVVGDEQVGVRPGLIIQNDIGNRFSPVTAVVAISTKMPKREYPFEVLLPQGVLPQPSVLMCNHVRTVDKGRLRPERLAVLDADTMRRVERALLVSLGIPT